MNITQKIISIAVFWLLFSLISIWCFRYFDRDYKLKYLKTNVYKLDKLKYFFFYYNRKSGEIAKCVFWLNIALYLLSVTFLSFWIAFVIMQTYLLQLTSVIIMFAHFGISMVTAGFNIYYDVQTDKKNKANGGW